MGSTVHGGIVLSVFKGEFQQHCQLENIQHALQPAVAGVLTSLSLGLVTLSIDHNLSEKGGKLVSNTSVTENCEAALPLHCVSNQLFSGCLLITYQISLISP